MENSSGKNNNLLYPPRPSEIVHRTDFLSDVQPLPLTEAGKTEISAFEEPLFGELQKLKGVTASTHLIYPEAFVDERGSRIFSAIYLDESLKTRLEILANRYGLDFKEVNIKQQLSDAFFNDILKITHSKEVFQSYREEGVEFADLGKVLTKLGVKVEEPVVFKGEILKSDGLSKEGLEEKFFSEVDLGKIPEQLRIRTNRYSSEQTKEQFVQAFQNCGGNVDKVPNPERIIRIVDVNKLTQRVGALRDFKVRLKKMGKELDGENGDQAEAKRIVISLYQRYINVLIAQEYDSGRILSAQSKRTEQEEKTLGILKGTNQVKENDRFSPEKASRTIERIDHFLAGSGTRIGENGLIETIPESLVEYAKQRASEPPPETTADFQRFNNYKVDAQQAAVLCEVILKGYGLTEGDKPWKAVVLERKGTLGISKQAREVRIPKSFDRGLIDSLTVLAHEVEGHALRYENQKKSLGMGLHLIDEFTAGRGGILSEAAAMRVEDDTEQKMVGVKREAVPYYYLILQEKRKGGSFKECFKTFFEAVAKRKYGLSLQTALDNKEVFEEVVNYTYDRTMRVFGRNTPLNDTSGYLPTSEQLEYIEQELVVDVLRKKGLTKLLHIAGIDLYSLQELRRLGMLDLNGIEEPKMIVANDIWPKLKRVLDEGKPIEKAIESLS